MSTLVAGIGSKSLRHARKTIAFDGGAGTGATGTVTVFTISGRILLVDLVAFCTEDLASAGGGTIALGTAGSTALFIAATTATDIDNGEFWLDTTPAVNEALPAALKEIAVSQTIIGTVAVGDITDGTIIFDVWYMPITDGATLS